MCLDVVDGSTRLGTKVAFIDVDAATDPHWQPGHGHRLPPHARTDLALRGAAELIRRLHSAALGFQSAITCYRFHHDPVPLENLIAFLTCAFASSQGAVVVGWPGATQDRLPTGSPDTRLGRAAIPQGHDEGC
jgi:hypothetical protein